MVALTWHSRSQCLFQAFYKMTNLVLPTLIGGKFFLVLQMDSNVREVEWLRDLSRFIQFGSGRARIQTQAVSGCSAVSTIKCCLSQDPFYHLFHPQLLSKESC